MRGLNDAHLAVEKGLGMRALYSVNEVSVPTQDSFVSDVVVALPEPSPVSNNDPSALTPEVAEASTPTTEESATVDPDDPVEVVEHMHGKDPKVVISTETDTVVDEPAVADHVDETVVPAPDEVDETETNKSTLEALFEWLKPRAQNGDFAYWQYILHKIVSAGGLDAQTIRVELMKDLPLNLRKAKAAEKLQSALAKLMNLRVVEIEGGMFVVKTIANTPSPDARGVEDQATVVATEIPSVGELKKPETELRSTFVEGTKQHACAVKIVDLFMGQPALRQSDMIRQLEGGGFFTDETTGARQNMVSVVTRKLVEAGVLTRGSDRLAPYTINSEPKTTIGTDQNKEKSDDRVDAAEVAHTAAPKADSSTVGIEVDAFHGLKYPERLKKTVELVLGECVDGLVREEVVQLSLQYKPNSVLKPDFIAKINDTLFMMTNKGDVFMGASGRYMLASHVTELSGDALALQQAAVINFVSESLGGKLSLEALKVLAGLVGYRGDPSEAGQDFLTTYGKNVGEIDPQFALQIIDLVDDRINAKQLGIGFGIRLNTLRERAKETVA